MVLGGNARIGIARGSKYRMARDRSRPHCDFAEFMTRPALAFPKRLGILTNPYLFYMSKSILDPARIADIEFSNDEIARYSRHLSWQTLDFA